MAYSEDMRKRALELIASGKSVAEISRLLNVSVSSLIRWQHRQKEGRLGAWYPKTRGSYKVDEEKLKAYVAEHPDAYLYEIAEAIGSKTTTVDYALRRLGITRKKRPRNIANETRKSALPITKI